jgi:hypothetical protein
MQTEADLYLHKVQAHEIIVLVLHQEAWSPRRRDCAGRAHDQMLALRVTRVNVQYLGSSGTGKLTSLETAVVLPSAMSSGPT